MKKQIHLKSGRPELDVLVTTISGKPLGQIPENSITSMTKRIGSPSEIELNIPRYYLDLTTLEQKTYPLFREIKNERQIRVDGDEVYSIKSIERLNDESLRVVAKSREVRLSDIDIDVEDCRFCFFNPDSVIVKTDGYEEIDGDKTQILSLNDYLYQETGWRLGTISPSILYLNGKDGEENTRRYESIEKKWYDFLTIDLTEDFNCIVSFNSTDKTVDFLMEEEIGDDIGLYLSKDNYIKNMTRIFDSDKLVTRMKLVGNDEMDISGSICTGDTYIENYNYFIENDEMSEELIHALEVYYKMVAIREPQWAKMAARREDIYEEKRLLGADFTLYNAKRTAKHDVLDILNLDEKTDKAYKAMIIADITQLDSDIARTRIKIENLEDELEKLNIAIDNIVTLCKKPTATDENGRLIFNSKLLDELKEYSYTETYKNDSFLTENVGQLVELGKRKLKEKAFPTFKWELDVVNFLERLQPIGTLNWTGELSLGDLIILYDREEDTEEFIYFIGYKHNVQDHELEITLSNKKTTKQDGLTIADYLTDARNAMRALDAKKYLLIQQKYNRLNLPRQFNPKYKEAERKRPQGTITN